MLDIGHSIPKDSKWYIIYRVQLRNISIGRLQGFLDEANVIQAEAQRVSKGARHTQDLRFAADTRVVSLYTDGSHKPDGQHGLPNLTR